MKQITKKFFSLLLALTLVASSSNFVWVAKAESTTFTPVYYAGVISYYTDGTFAYEDAAGEHLIGFNQGVSTENKKNIVIPAHVKVIKRNENIINNVVTVSVAEGSVLETIEAYAFEECKLLGKIDLSNATHLKTIGERAFYSSKILSEVTLPESSELEIGEKAFIWDTGLKSIKIPASVTTLGQSCFKQCTNLRTVEFADNSNLKTIGVSAFEGDSSIEKIKIPASVTMLGDSCFKDCTSLLSVEFAEGSRLETIGNSAFRNTRNLESIAIPSSVTTIGTNSFLECKSLSTVTFADDSRLKTIGDSAFNGVTTLESITIPKTVKTIGASCFSGCTKLTDVGITPDSQLETLESNAFGKSGLTKITIPKTVIKIGSKCFQYCTSLGPVYFMGNPVNVASDSFFHNNHYSMHVCLYTYNFKAYGEAETNYIEKFAIQTGYRYNYYVDDIEIVKNELADTSITDENYLKFFVGDKFNTLKSQVAAKVTYTKPDGTPGDQTAIVPYKLESEYGINEIGNVTSFSTGKAGEQEIKITYGAKEKTENITVYNNFSKCTITPVSKVYTGKKIEPTDFVVKDAAGGTLRLGTHYKITGYDKNVDVSSRTSQPTVTMEGLEDKFYLGQKVGTFTITQKPVTDEDIKVSFKDGKGEYTYTGGAIEPEVVVTQTYADGEEKTLTKDTDYIVNYKNNVNAGEQTATANITGIGNYKDLNETAKYTIKRCDISDATNHIEVADIEDQLYTGSEIAPVVTLTRKAADPSQKDKTLKATDYEVSYAKNKDMGEATITITGVGNYTGTVTKTFKIIPVPLSNVTVAPIEDVTYTEKAVEPTLNMSYNGSTLVKDTDYTISIQEGKNIDCGTVAVTITGKGNYDGTLEKSFKIIPVTIGNAVASEIEPITYTGKEIKPEFELTTDSGKKLVKDTDYEISSYEKNTLPGEATIVVAGKGNYTGTKNINFTIKPFSIVPAKVTLSYETTAYNGVEQRPEVTVTLNDKELEEGTDYAVSIAGDEDTKVGIDVGTVKVVVTGMGIYGDVNESASYKIEQADVKDVTVESIKEQVYTGTSIVPEVTLKQGAYTLVKDTDYKVFVGTQKDIESIAANLTAPTDADKMNVAAGIGSIVIVGIGSYKGSIAKEFTIRAKDITKTVQVDLSSAEAEYTGQDITPDVTVKNGTETLVKDRDYTVTYTNNKEAGIANVVVKGIGNYSFESTKQFTINAPATVAAPKTEAKNVKKPGKVKVSSIKSSKGKKVVFKFKKIKGAAGYEVSIGLDKKFSKGKVVKTTKKTSVTLKVKNAGTYFARVRSYKIIKGKKVFGAYSKAMKVKVTE